MAVRPPTPQYRRTANTRATPGPDLGEMIRRLGGRGGMPEAAPGVTRTRPLMGGVPQAALAPSRTSLPRPQGGLPGRPVTPVNPPPGAPLFPIQARPTGNPGQTGFPGMQMLGPQWPMSPEFEDEDQSNRIANALQILIPMPSYR